MKTLIFVFIVTLFCATRSFGYVTAYSHNGVGTGSQSETSDYYAWHTHVDLKSSSEYERAAGGAYYYSGASVIGTYFKQVYNSGYTVYYSDYPYIRGIYSQSVVMFATTSVDPGHSFVNCEASTCVDYYIP